LYAFRQFFDQITLPLAGVETKQIAHRSEGKHLSLSTVGVQRGPAG